MYSNAKRKLARLKLFYIRLTAYLVICGLIIWNLIIIEDTTHANVILALNYSTIIPWGIVIIIHAWKTFKGKILFSNKWEEAKLKSYMEK